MNPRINQEVARRRLSPQMLPNEQRTGSTLSRPYSIGKRRIDKENHRAKTVCQGLVSCREASAFGNVFDSQLPKLTSVHLRIEAITRNMVTFGS